MKKFCTTCKLEKEITCFSPNKTSPDGYHSKCKSCKATASNSYYYANRESVLSKVKYYRDTNKEAIKIIQRNAHLKNKYGLTVDQYKDLLQTQNNRCAICGVRFTGKIKPDVDHSHKTNKVRGILCRYCNLVAGVLENYGHIDDMQLYLKRG